MRPPKRSDGSRLWIGALALSASLLISLPSTAGSLARNRVSSEAGPAARAAHPERLVSSPGTGLLKSTPRTHTIERGETLAEVLRGFDVGRQEVSDLVESITRHWDVRKAQVGSQVQVTLDPVTGAVDGLSVETDDDRRVVVRRREDGYESRIVSTPAPVPASQAQPEPPRVEAAEASKVAAAPSPVSDPDLLRRSDTLSRGETLSKLLRGMGVSAAETVQVVNAVAKKWNVRRADIGTRVDLVLDKKSGDVRSLTIQERNGSPVEISFAEAAQSGEKVAPTPASQSLPEASDALAQARTVPQVATLGRGETLAAVLGDLGIGSRDVARIVPVVSKKWNVRKAQIGTKISLDLDPATRVVRSIVVDAKQDKARLRVPLTGIAPVRLDGAAVVLPATPVVAAVATPAPPQADASVARASAPSTAPPSPRVRVATGRIQTSFYEAATKSGLDPAIITDLANVFAWEIDFSTELHRGDGFRVMYEAPRSGDKSSRGQILAAEITAGGEPHRAFLVRSKDGRPEYYNDEGRTQRKPFLKSPLAYTRVTSPFTMGRFHPIFGSLRPHLGVDLAAPEGTPIRAVGDGVIEVAGWHGGDGRFVKVHHDATYASSYSHLSGIAPAVREGKRVTQGQVIGYVGHTGWATGPHLHFAFWKNGDYVDPFKVKVTGGRVLTARERRDFDGLRTARLAAMDSVLTSGASRVALAATPR